MPKTGDARRSAALAPEPAPRTAGGERTSRASLAAFARSLGPGCLLALVLSACRQADTPLGLMGTQVLAFAVHGFLAGAVLAALACIAVGRRAPAPGSLRAGGGRAALVAGAASLAGAAGTAALAAWGGQGTPALAGALASGAALGAGCTVLAVAWSELLARLHALCLVRAVAGVLAVAGVCCLAFRLVDGPVAACIALGLLALASTGAWLAADRPSPAGSSAAGAGLVPAAAPGSVAQPVSAAAQLAAMSDGGSRVAGMPMGTPRVLDLCRMLWIPLAGVVLSAFIVGLTWDPVVAYEDGWRTPEIAACGVLAGSVLAAATVFLVARKRDAVATLGLLGRAVLLAALALVLIVPVVQQAAQDQAVYAAADVATSAGFALLSAVAYVDLVLACALTGVPARRAVGGLVVLVAAAVWAGMGAIDVWGTAGRTVCLVVEALFLTAVGISYALRPHGGNGASANPPVTGAPGPEVGGIDERCALLAREAGLSPREAQVLLHLGRGYGSTHIAFELGISENTVRTHTRHIYEKLGLSSREELLTRVNG